MVNRSLKPKSFEPHSSNDIKILKIANYRKHTIFQMNPNKIGMHSGVIGFKWFGFKSQVVNVGQIESSSPIVIVRPAWAVCFALTRISFYYTSIFNVFLPPSYGIRSICWPIAVIWIAGWTFQWMLTHMLLTVPLFGFGFELFENWQYFFVECLNFGIKFNMYTYFSSNKYFLV